MQLTAVSFFNYIKEAASAEQILDYRFTGGNPNVESWIRSYAGNLTAYQGGYDGAAHSLPLPRTLYGTLFLLVLARTLLP
jgi:hypothetical protein